MEVMSREQEAEGSLVMATTKDERPTEAGLSMQVIDASSSSCSASGDEGTSADSSSSDDRQKTD